MTSLGRGLAGAWLLVGVLACSGDDETTTEEPLTGGQVGGGQAGSSSAGGGGGTKGGSSGSSGQAGRAGTGGTTAGTAGASAGQGGEAGEAGASGGAGMSGGSGQGGAAGEAGSGPTVEDVFETFAKDRLACKFGPGQTTAETISATIPHGDALPFKHIVVLMLENRSFDHYFAKLPSVGVTDVDVADETHFNYDPDANPVAKVPFHHESRYCIKDTNHEWEGVHLQYDQGKMDGFVATNSPGGARAMGYYDQDDIPYYYWMAQTFGLSDRHFSSLLGPTWPNRFFFYGASSWGNTKTGDLGDILPGSTVNAGKKIIDQLDDAGRSWKIYRDGLASFALIFGQSKENIGSPMSKFESDVDGGSLPDLAILDPSFTSSGQNDEHPPSNIQKGQQLTARVLNKLMSKPDVWKKTVFFLMYDEHGGFYDHVAPPAACEPDDNVPATFKFDRLGVRTPLIVASPFVKKGYVSHRVTDHTSVTRFIQHRFDLPALTHRDANAWPMLDFFDFDHPAFVTPPKGAPSAIIDAEHEAWCKNNPPGDGVPQ